VSCAKIAELTEMQCGMLESGRSREHVLHCDVDAPTSRGTFKGVWQIVKYSNAQDLGLCKRVSCAKKGGPTLMIYTLYDMFCTRSCLFGVAMIAPAQNF